MKIIIALDAMGGDHGAKITVPAALSALEKEADLELILVGQANIIEAELKKCGAATSERLRIHNATEIVDMDEPPALALKKKKDSSMRVALNLVKEGKALACVSAGNTGALMAMARFVLKMLPGIDRPAICKMMPTMTGRHVYMLDLGANIDSPPEQLVQFAIMGSELARTANPDGNPSIGLLNVGEEDIKGSETVKKANELLRAAPVNYAGYVEGDEIYKGKTDVVVCDGFVGNVALKTTEGLAKMISQFMKEEFRRNLITRLGALAALPALKAFSRRVDPRRYNGASLLGLRGIVIKSHGGADSLAFEYAIEEAVEEARAQVPSKIGSKLEALAKVA